MTLVFLLISWQRNRILTHCTENTGEKLKQVRILNDYIII
jgi:hypothetical protein